MKSILLVVLLGLTTVAPNVFAQSTEAKSGSEAVVEKPTEETQDAERIKVPIATLSDEKLEELLDRRLDGELGHSFRQFSNMFLVKSKIQFGAGIGLMSKSIEISNAPLQPVYPDSYQPTLREFLDQVGLQTSSTWKYDEANQFVASDAELKDRAPIEDLAIFEFSPVANQRAKPYEIELAEGWKTIDNGNWVMHVPPTFPIGLDVYEMGVYTTDDADKETFRQQIRNAVSLQWAQRVSPEAKLDDLVNAKIGEYDALHFTAMIPSQLGKDIKWRQWVFMVEGRCYFIVSTILPEMDDKIFPDVEKMLASFGSNPGE